MWGWDVGRIVNAYHDPLLQASFLRCARSDEFRLLDVYKTDKAVRQVLFTSPNPDLTQTALLAAEHALASSMGKYQQPTRSSVVEAALKVLRHSPPDVFLLMSYLVRNQLAE